MGVPSWWGAGGQNVPRALAGPRSLLQPLLVQLECVKVGRKQPQSSALGLGGWAGTPPNPAPSWGRLNPSPWICFSLSKGEVLW